MQPVELAAPNNTWDQLFASIGIKCKYCLRIFGAVFVCHRAPTMCKVCDMKISFKEKFLTSLCKIEVSSSLLSSRRLLIAFVRVDALMIQVVVSRGNMMKDRLLQYTKHCPFNIPNIQTLSRYPNAM